MVGKAVRKGQGTAAGRIYQLLAVFLTYSSIVAMNVPLLLEAMPQALRPGGRRPRSRQRRESAGLVWRSAGATAAGADGKKAAPAEDAVEEGRR